MQNLAISNNVVVSLDETSLRDLGVISLVQLNASSNYISETYENLLEKSKLHTVDLSSNSLGTSNRRPSYAILPSRHCRFLVTTISDCLRMVLSFTHIRSEF